MCFVGLWTSVERCVGGLALVATLAAPAAAGLVFLREHLRCIGQIGIGLGFADALAMDLWDEVACDRHAQ